jgi:hypothetical protein
MEIPSEMITLITKSFQNVQAILEERMINQLELNIENKYLEGKQKQGVK